MTYSAVATTVLDYATSEAKRSDSGKVTLLHLLAGIRNWNTRRFDELFPDQWPRVQAALGRLKGDGARPDGPDEATAEILKEIKQEPDVWSAAEGLLKRADLGIHDGDSLDGTVSAGGTPEAPSSAPDPLTIGLNTALAGRVAAAIGETAETVATTMADDIASIVSTVVGRYDTAEVEALRGCTDLEPRVGEAPANRSNLLARVIATPEAALAKELASAYVSAASWAASLDETVTDEEVARIDALRVQLRAELAADDDPEPARLADFEEAFRDIIGLESVKTELRQRIDYFMVVQRRRARGLKVSNHSMHMAFLGNPGTGKTTVARIFAEVLHEMGLLETGTLVEVDRSGLVGEFVGHTETKTNSVVDSALGGVLLIDEAYALADTGHMGKSFGDIAIDILIKRMEDDRDRLMLIVAGYAEPMRTFLDRNEGMNSRIPLKLTFPDYSPAELVEVAERFAKNDGLVLDDGCRKRFLDAAEQLARRKNFGNARDIRNIYEQTVRNQFSRMADLGDLATTDEMSTLLESDVPELPNEPKQKQIGFR